MLILSPSFHTMLDLDLGLLVVADKIRIILWRHDLRFSWCLPLLLLRLLVRHTLSVPCQRCQCGIELLLIEVSNPKLDVTSHTSVSVAL